MKLTKKQFDSLHLWFSLLAKEMAARGLDMRKVLEPSIEITPTKDLVKKYVWKPIQLEKYEKESTKEIDHEELQGVYEDLSRHFLTQWGINLPFPSEDNLELIRNLEKEFNL